LKRVKIGNRLSDNRRFRGPSTGRSGEDGREFGGVDVEWRSPLKTCGGRGYNSKCTIDNSRDDQSRGERRRGVLGDYHITAAQDPFCAQQMILVRLAELARL